MFYYRITVTTRRGTGQKVTTTRLTESREYLRPADLGEFVGQLVAKRPGPRRVTVEPISQAAYVRATRGGE